MLQHMTGDELHGWRRFYLLEPFGEERADFRNALLITALVKAMGGRKAKVPDFKTLMPFSEDPVLDDGKKYTPVTGKAMRTKIDRFAKALGGGPRRKVPVPKKT